MAEIVKSESTKCSQNTYKCMYTDITIVKLYTYILEVVKILDS